MKNILHRHKYKIIGTGHDSNENSVQVDILCKCGRYGTVYVEDCFSEKVIKQAAKGKYFNVPRIIYSELITQ